MLIVSMMERLQWSIIQRLHNIIVQCKILWQGVWHVKVKIFVSHLSTWKIKGEKFISFKECQHIQQNHELCRIYIQKQ